jgi:hypothetical protein
MSEPAPRRRRAPRAAEIARLAALLAGAAMAPVVGDIGSCGQEAEELDAFKFFYVKASTDCERCAECGIETRACAEACDPAPKTAEFPPSCHPLIHDGEVCLHALEVASCAEYGEYMSDEAPTSPTECNFCPLDQDPSPPPATGGGTASAAPPERSGR